MIDYSLPDFNELSEDNFMSFGVDTDGNGIEDTFEIVGDLNDDGFYETIIIAHDYDQDGNIDSTTTYVDVDADNNSEIVVKSHTDNDPDSTKVSETEAFADLTGSGEPDMHIHRETHMFTDDMEVTFETTEVAGMEPVENIYAYDHSTGEIYHFTAGENYNTTIAAGLVQLDNFDPATADPDAVVGTPGTDMEVWECQGPTNRCALFSQKFVIEQITGDEVPIEEIVQVAENYGWFDESDNGGGTAFLNMNKVLNVYGIQNDMSFHNTIDDLKSELEAGNKVIVSIDSDQVWFGQDPNIFSPMSSADHAVEVIGIDYSNPQEPMVILNDSGSLDGCGEMVPLAVFDAAWEAGDRQMITCYA